MTGWPRGNELGSTSMRGNLRHAVTRCKALEQTCLLELMILGAEAHVNISAGLKVKERNLLVSHKYGRQA